MDLVEGPFDFMTITNITAKYGFAEFKRNHFFLSEV
jgi:hypothetical protein